MKNILICLTFVVVSAMGETNYKIEKNEIETQLTQEEKFNMLFGETGLSFHEIRKKRTSRNIRNNRVFRTSNIIEVSHLTQEERYELLFGKTLLRKRVARTARFIFPRQARRSLYLTANF